MNSKLLPLFFLTLALTACSCFAQASTQLNKSSQFYFYQTSETSTFPGDDPFTVTVQVEVLSPVSKGEAVIVTSPVVMTLSQVLSAPLVYHVISHNGMLDGYLPSLYPPHDEYKYFSLNVNALDASLLLEKDEYIIYPNGNIYSYQTFHPQKAGSTTLEYVYKKGSGTTTLQIPVIIQDSTLNNSTAPTMNGDESTAGSAQ